MDDDTKKRLEALESLEKKRQQRTYNIVMYIIMALVGLATLYFAGGFQGLLHSGS